MNPVILLVDIPSANRDELKHFLQDQHYEVVVSNYAESAVGYSRQLQPDSWSFSTIPFRKPTASLSAVASKKTRSINSRP
jgi:hypothetical protein